MENIKLVDLIYKIVKSEDRLAFKEIFNYFAPRIMGYLVSSGMNKEIAEELTQEILTTVWEKSYQFDEKKAKVSTWIFTIARNKKIDLIRKNSNPNYNPLDLLDALYSKDTNENDLYEEKIAKNLSNLKKNEKKLIKMNFFEGKSHKMISEQLEIPLGTIKSRIRNILNKIKNN
ncbi:sigma-70 family RNA polymerase sigma factor [Alphaproteobacteria bacterium]|nr:sigma-70 family RNA polymerase sigma factor [Alphaproteobacteria bacterium]